MQPNFLFAFSIEGKCERDEITSLCNTHTFEEVKNTYGVSRIATGLVGKVSLRSTRKEQDTVLHFT
jgi:hypothetical protein